MPLYLSKLILTNFKNYPSYQVDFHPDLNVITGLNGAGKTNLLDAVYYLCFCKSAFQARDPLNILDGESFFRIEGGFNSAGDGEGNVQVDVISCAYMKGRKKVMERNKIPYKKITEHIGFCPLVLIAPDDVQIVKGGSSERRRLLDGTLSQYDLGYLEALLQYERVRKQRNALLKQFATQKYFDETLIQTYDEQLILFGQEIFEKRKQLLKDLHPIFQSFYQNISSSRELVDFRFESQLEQNTLGNLLKKSREKDRIMQRTTVGIHKDDLLFEIKSFELKQLGSQGQQKSFLIALKLAIYQLLAQKTNQQPLLLLDDIFDKLDGERIEHLLKLVTGENFGQIFVTDTHTNRLGDILDKLSLDFKHFEIEIN